MPGFLRLPPRAAATLPAERPVFPLRQMRSRPLENALQNCHMTPGSPWRSGWSGESLLDSKMASKQASGTAATGKNQHTSRKNYLIKSIIYEADDQSGGESPLPFPGEVTLRKK